MLRRCLVLLGLIVVLAGASAKTPPADEAPLTLGVVGFYNPRVMYLRYQPLIDYLSVHTGHRWKLVISTDYQETVDDLCSGGLTLAYMGPFTYVRARQACGAEPLVRLNTDGSPSYTSMILVRQDSPIRRLTQLDGLRIGFGAPLSTSSHLVPRGMLRDAGVEVPPERAVFYGHHEQAARAVLLGDVDACGIRDIVAERFSRRGLRVLAQSDPLPNFPLAAPVDLDPGIRKSIIDALVVVPRGDAEIRREMGHWHAELRGGFARCADADYDPIRTLARRVFGPDAMSMPAPDVAAGGRR